MSTIVVKSAGSEEAVSDGTITAAVASVSGVYAEAEEPAAAQMLVHFVSRECSEALATRRATQRKGSKVGGTSKFAWQGIARLPPNGRAILARCGRR